LDGLTVQTTQMLEPDSSLRYELENTLRELGRAAQSVRQFSDYLERNPNALLTGRAAQSE
jgi:paraquat-inducible protein B